MTWTLDDARHHLHTHGQEHLLTGWERLDDAGRARLLTQLTALDWAHLAGWASAALAPPPAPAATLAPPPHPATRAALPAAVHALGEAALAAGAVAAFTVAGGDGTRLGHPGPKGTFPAGPVTGRSLFALLAASVRGARARAKAALPWVVMTSPENHAATVAHFEAHAWFGLPRGDVLFCTQGTLPTFDTAGRLLLDAPDRLATHPDGHGGSLRALVASGALAALRDRGVATLAYCQVDNPLVRIFDPALIGLHLDPDYSSAEMSSKIVPKISPEERVGVFATVDGRVRVVEYSDLPPALAAARGPGGELLFGAGNVAIHALGLSFVERLWAQDAWQLPLHAARKEVIAFDPTREASVRVEALKLETFVFDALPTCARPALLAVDRAEEFAPIKATTGPDSPSTCAAALTARGAAWLEAAGVAVPRRADGAPDCVIEILGDGAKDAQDVVGWSGRPSAIPRGAAYARCVP